MNTCLETQTTDSGSKKSLDDVDQQHQQEEDDGDAAKEDAAKNGNGDGGADDGGVTGASEPSMDAIQPAEVIVTAARDTAHDRDQMLTR